jgi:hypothetical protein
VAILTVFGRPVPQSSHLLAQATYLLAQKRDQDMSHPDHLLLFDEFVMVHKLLSQDLILFSHPIEFFSVAMPLPYLDYHLLTSPHQTRAVIKSTVFCTVT